MSAQYTIQAGFSTAGATFANLQFSTLSSSNTFMSQIWPLSQPASVPGGLCPRRHTRTHEDSSSSRVIEPPLCPNTRLSPLLWSLYDCRDDLSSSPSLCELVVAAKRRCNSIQRLVSTGYSDWNSWNKKKCDTQDMNRANRFHRNWIYGETPEEPSLKNFLETSETREGEREKRSSREGSWSTMKKEKRHPER